MKRTLGFVLGLAGLVTVSVVGAVNCGQSTIISQTVGPEGAAITITAEMDRDLAGVEIVIPPGALPEATRISIARAADAPSDVGTAVGPAVFVGPEGLAFQQPITIDLPTARPIAATEQLGAALTEVGSSVVYVDGKVVAVSKSGRLMPPAPDFGGEDIRVTPHANGVSITSSYSSTFQPVIVTP
jgi:hypothetical protein